MRGEKLDLDDFPIWLFPYMAYAANPKIETVNFVELDVKNKVHFGICWVSLIYSPPNKSGNF